MTNPEQLARCGDDGTDPDLRVFAGALLERCPVVQAVAPQIAHALWGQSDSGRLNSAQRKQARNIAVNIRRALDQAGLLKTGGFSREELHAKDAVDDINLIQGIRSDPMEQLIERALIAADIPYLPEGHPQRTPGVFLDFELSGHIYIEVKRMHTDRIAKQMAQAENVIVAQGKQAVEFLAAAIARATQGSAQP